MHRIDAAGFAPGNLFTDGNPATGTPATVVDAVWLNDIQENLIRFIENLGVTPVSGNFDQLIEAISTRAIQRNAPAVAVAGGTANALTASFTPAVATLTAGMTFTVRATAANTVTTPTFTPNSGVIPAKTIVKANNQALNAGDIAGAGHWIALTYDLTLDRWVLENPAATGASAQIQPITASVAANALTLTLNPTRLDFRNATLTNGAVSSRTVATALSLTVPQGATLGATNGQPARLVLLAIDNAGTVELAVVNIAGGNALDESGVISTTAISAAATAANVFYSTTGRTNVPYRVVGFIDSTQATAGTYASAPTLVQGAGGLVLSALAGASLSANGYQRLPSGLIVQWGTSAAVAADATVTVTFPIAFPTACHSVVANAVSPVTSGAVWPTFNVNNKTTTNFQLINDGGNTAPGNWIAIGN
ncbi:MAG: gp53-like domain-containing protein [Limnobacter sp.]|uniref:gp53-like domain-containing protein n=1 Tax=Limnobacter sp. TaxID=2003368 RepID=UPI00391D0476